ncbi:hypothetical protein C0Q70_19369 [Pomacea canaliculata]|uniref:receptor protein-tyrosine kinase n=2 Tax=Pomacea canaliculata TaxID=400727 RepID=A0A2T7NJ58_POMCA|nr:hypothetical protein C0Q70_19369 [Pomacea canaliculata]
MLTFPTLCGVIIYAIFVQASASCITNEPCKLHHYFYHNGHELPLVLENSNRDSHQVANHILKIILEDILCYHSIDIRHQSYYDNVNASAALDRITGCSPAKCKGMSMDSVPETMINLESWMVAGFDKAPWVDTKRLIDAGPLGPYGRMGWFLSSSCVEEMWAQGVMVDHWRALLNSTVARSFSWWGNPELLQVCPHYNVTAYKSSRCTKSRRNCATLFSSFKGLDAGMLQQQIETLGLPVDIVWLDTLLEDFVLNQTSAGKHILFFSWVPSRLTLVGNFTRINFPEHYHEGYYESVKQRIYSTTEFQVNQFSKVTWYRVKAGAPEAFQVISRMNFPQQVYYDFLQEVTHNPHLKPEETACNWVQENRAVWEKWVPVSLTKKPKLYLAGLFPLTGGYWTAPGLVVGAKFAIDMVNQDSSVLPTHELDLIVNDTRCRADVALNNFIKLMLMQDHSFKILGILGPGCSDAAEPIAALTGHFHTLMVSYGAEASSLADRAKYPYFFRTIPQVNHYRFVYAEFFKAMGWTQVGALAEGGQELPEYHLQLQEYLQEQGVSVLVKRKLVRNPEQLDLSVMFKEIRERNVHVIIADFYDNVARAVMCEAYRQKMTAHQGYVWFLPAWYPMDWWDVDFYNSPTASSDPRPQEFVPCTTAEMEYAIEGHFIIAKRNTDNEDLTAVGGITIKQFKEIYALRVGKAYVDESPFASFVYDAVWVFAKGLHNLLTANPAALDSLGDERMAKAYMKAINETHFQGVSGYIRFDGSDRLGSILIQQFFHNETVNVALYTPQGTDKEGSLIINHTKIRWLSPLGAHPSFINAGGHTCAVEDFRAFLGVECETAIIIANVMGFVAFVIITIICLVLLKCRYDAKVKATHQRMKELGLLSSEYSHCLTLDEWEIPRKNVVLNRKLGEGAFGTVCGGEMLDGDHWVAVAVKTLKIRHSMEEKLDFFSEVGMMKRFKHPNIVALLGVCTRTEPVYAIMEFLLHGDLKTYLLSRRSLVDQNVKESEDVNAESLTRMAIDIATGLQYLHQLKYVHRDLACRNCLVHANKTVKISDFGMTRHISDSDYYRFTRKGMLPVRWMSPESLVDGLFTFKSDIWSFGVVVYEIVTFGSFPYQGLSNTQVLDYVKQGNRLILPDNCPEDLRSFIHWCMFYDQGFRPDLEDILDYLHFNQKFLVPCLDTPIASVVMEDTDSLEMALSPDQGTVTHSTLPSGLLQRRSGSWQDKLALAARKTLSVPSKCIPKSHTRTLLFGLDRAHSNSMCMVQSPTAMDSLLPTDDTDLRMGNLCNRQLSSRGTSEMGDSGERGDSDYFSDNSKEVCQTVTTV